MRNYFSSTPPQTPMADVVRFVWSDCWFGFIFWGMAYLTLYPGAKRWAGVGRSLETAFNYFLILFGAYVLVAGTYVRISLPSPLCIRFPTFLSMSLSDHRHFLGNIDLSTKYHR